MRRSLCVHRDLLQVVSVMTRESLDVLPHSLPLFNGFGNVYDILSIRFRAASLMPAIGRTRTSELITSKDRFGRLAEIADKPDAQSSRRAPRRPAETDFCTTG